MLRRGPSSKVNDEKYVCNEVEELHDANAMRARLPSTLPMMTAAALAESVHAALIAETRRARSMPMDIWGLPCRPDFPAHRHKWTALRLPTHRRVLERVSGRGSRARLLTI
jgi:hypothetical protein